MPGPGVLRDHRAAPEAPLPSLCSERCDPVPPTEPHLLASGTRLCTTPCPSTVSSSETPDLSTESHRRPAPRSTPQEVRQPALGVSTAAREHDSQRPPTCDCPWPRRSSPRHCCDYRHGDDRPRKLVADRDRSDKNRSHHSSENLGQPEDMISPVTRRDRHCTAAALRRTLFGQILTDPTAVTAGRSITANNSATAFATVIWGRIERTLTPTPGRSRCLAEHRPGPVELARAPGPLLPAPTNASRPGPVPRRAEGLGGHRSGPDYARAFHGHREQDDDSCTHPEIDH